MNDYTQTTCIHDYTNVDDIHLHTIVYLNTLNRVKHISNINISINGEINYNSLNNYPKKNHLK